MRQLPFQYAFRNLGRSRVRLAASLLGSSLVVLLILASGGFVRGMQLTLTHRAGLHDAAMLKENHLHAAGGITAAVQALRAAHPGVTLTVEVETLAQLLLSTTSVESTTLRRDIRTRKRRSDGMQRQRRMDLYRR